MNKLISISDNCLTLEKIKEDDKNVFVISMLGCARVGKSTFINGLTSYIFNENKYVAKTSSKSEHCTQGIDYISVDYNDLKLIILDCQGLNYEDSKNDDKLLSFIYSVSNLIVYHDVNIINNQTLNTLTSLCLVLNCIKDNDRKNKPTLYFRMRDYNLESPVDDIIERTFTQRNDQYDNVRNAIKKLFPKINGFFTEPMGKKEQHLINNKEYDLLYDDLDDYNFKSCFDEILSNVNKDNTTCFNDLIKHMEKTVEQINKNESITFENYDYYTLLIKKRFQDFVDNIDKSIYNKVMTTKCQISVNKLESKIEQINLIIDNFKEQFKEIDDTLIEKQIEIIFSELLKEQYESIEKCHKKAQNFIEENKTEIIQKSLESMNCEDNNDNIKHDFIKNLQIIIYEKFRKINICEKDVINFVNSTLKLFLESVTNLEEHCTTKKKNTKNILIK